MLCNQTIEELICQQYAFGAILFEEGIDLFAKSQLTLSQVCKANPFKQSRLEQAFLNLQATQKQGDDLFKQMQKAHLKDIIAVLVQMHRAFAKDRLHYIQHLVENAPSNHLPKEHKALLADLRLLLPIFVDEFIEHIHQEEQSIFAYIDQLWLVLKGQLAYTHVFYQMQEKPLMQLAQAHHQEDDQMLGIRELTAQYHLEEDAHFSMKILFAQLQQFESQLQTHALIEDRILFPKAIKLEKAVREMIQRRSRLN